MKLDECPKCGNTELSDCWSLKARQVRFRGCATLVQREKPLACGARVFIETRGALELL